MPLDRTDQHLMDLMLRIAAQDAYSAKALRELYDLTSARMFGLALRVTGNREWAEDALQEAYLNIWRIAGDYRAGLSPPMAWMGVIVRSRSLDFLRRRNSERADAGVELDDYLQDTLAGDGDDPLDMADASQQATALRQCLSRLENKQREVVSLAYLRDLSHSELAEQLKLPLGTVKTWIRRGLAQLRECMERFAS
ncbi:sigma-70 family RNA polymerase sigma factor [Xylophilus sp. Kf1]|nr:sigma-70 family RNA polymerase sigma factor [Xylophilus sp. Kf1]